MDETEERLEGGNVNVVVRVGATVRRPTQPWSQATQALLRHLETQGFDGAPRALGTDDQGREVLSFVPGEVPQYPLPAFARSEQTLLDVARLLRRYHDATLSPTLPPGAAWQSVVPGPAEVVCHNDVAPYNTVFQASRAVAFIDFDSAAPGPRLWDVVYAAYRFAPLEGGARDPQVWPTNLTRLQQFCGAYGLGADERHAFMDTLLARLEAMCAWLIQGASLPDSAQARLVRDGHLAYYEREILLIAAHRDEVQTALLRDGEPGERRR